MINQNYSERIDKFFLIQIHNLWD